MPRARKINGKRYLVKDPDCSACGMPEGMRAPVYVSLPNSPGGGLRLIPARAGPGRKIRGCIKRDCGNIAVVHEAPPPADEEGDGE